MLIRDCQLSGWGRTSSVRGTAARPASVSDLEELFKQDAKAPFLAYGGGRSYGDQALCTGGMAICTSQLTGTEDFDAEAGRVTVLGGTTFEQMIGEYLPQGYLLPVSPGTSFATMGGAIANDVHGKNHDCAGSFASCVEWIDLLTADNSIRRVSAEQDAAIYHATVGGGGLTGIILRARLRLRRVESNAVTLTETRVRDLEDFFAQLESARQQNHFTVGWIDALSRGSSLGRGILEAADFSSAPVKTRSGPNLKVPLDFPSVALNRWSVSAFNALYYRHVPATGRTRSLAIPKFLYPLDAIRDWNRIYGKRGFFQFQCVIPDADSFAAIKLLLEHISASGQGSFLAVLKTLGAEGQGYLAFPRRGYTLALDFPRSAASADLLKTLERVTLDYGGRIYLAKDAWLSADGFRQMYPRLDDMRSVLQEVDPGQRFDSDMARRLRLRG